MGMSRNCMADPVFSSVGSYVSWEGPWCAGRNVRKPNRSSGLKVKKIHNIAEYNIPQDLNLQQHHCESLRTYISLLICILRAHRTLECV